METVHISRAPGSIEWREKFYHGSVLLLYLCVSLFIEDTRKNIKIADEWEQFLVSTQPCRCLCLNTSVGPIDTSKILILCIWVFP